MNELAQLLPFLLIIVVFWFLVVRPARRQQQRLAATQAGVEVGSEVMLGSGFYGRVLGLGEDTVQLELAPGVEVKVARQAVVRVLTDEDRAVDGPADGTADPQA